jgi:gamma-glutamylcyclotransferase (GGCT)/AIG2-like uncharacterized protein YtfP
MLGTEPGAMGIGRAHATKSRLVPEWWQAPEFRHDLDRVVGHLRTARVYSRDSKDACLAIFDALNLHQNAYVRLQISVNSTAGADLGSQLTETAAFTRLFIDGVAKSRQQWLVESPSLRELAHLEPVQDHEVLGRWAGYRPNLGSDEFPPEILKEATADHRHFAEELRRWRPERSPRRVLRQLARLLYILRSNIAHGEKQPLGPDSRQAARDRLVCNTTLPVLLAVVEALFDNPRHRLAVYGTLAPDKPNHDRLAHLTGEWEQGSIWGERGEHHGLPTFRWVPDGPDVPVQLFSSPDLEPSWGSLDRFEGEAYARILVPVRMESGLTKVANLYQWNRDDLILKPKF